MINQKKKTKPIKKQTLMSKESLYTEKLPITSNQENISREKPKKISHNTGKKNTIPNN